ncbi:DNA-formamidopyrimidine glycosylase family protein [Oryzihumus leptocrescens]|uniref:DNA-(apurinic or apyrimidinic site) lyase n=1 Tax=Oryzihumus leptocrescens TaxID=297536 RepID=A0A542ZHD8_9MICO|nr:DNA-formamidopyrimidine glycosylase family protein [Oryzihumus leptocrescens]TQL59773.1 endonuclease-8 [Oryzihumus leptocrescens]
MPEGDTVWRTAHRLDQALAGSPLQVADLRWPSLATTDLRGATTLEVISRGKHILQRLDSGRTLHSHLRMEGQWRVEATPQVTARQLAGDRVRAVLGTADWTALGLRLGMLDLVPTADERTLVGHLGPDLLGPDWDPSLAVANLRREPGRALGAALLDQRNLAGIGTLWAAESLFLEGLHPWTPVGEVDDDALAGVVERAHRLLSTSQHLAVQTSTGSTRRGETSYAHARSGRPCRRCGGSIRVAMIGEPPQERTMFYCPGCQGGLGPTDDGRTQRPLGSGPRQTRAGYRPR